MPLYWLVGIHEFKNNDMSASFVLDELPAALEQKPEVEAAPPGEKVIAPVVVTEQPVELAGETPEVEHE